MTKDLVISVFREISCQNGYMLARDCSFGTLPFLQFFIILTIIPILYPRSSTNLATSESFPPMTMNCSSAVICVNPFISLSS